MNLNIIFQEPSYFNSLFNISLKLDNFNKYEYTEYYIELDPVTISTPHSAHSTCPSHVSRKPYFNPLNLVKYSLNPIPSD